MSHKGYLYFNSTGCVYIARSVSFNEDEFPFVHGFPSNNSITFLTSSVNVSLVPQISQWLSNSQSSQHMPSGTTSFDATQSEDFHAATPTSSVHVQHVKQGNPQQSSTKPIETSIVLPNFDEFGHYSPNNNTYTCILKHYLVSTHPIITISKSGIFKPKVYISQNQSQLASELPKELEPENIDKALSNKSWKKAKNEEYDALMKNQTWTLVLFQEGMNVVQNKWVFKVKYLLNGTIQRYKA